jgi:MFS family permease
MASVPDASPGGILPRNVKVLGAASLLNDIASEMIFPLMPHFLLKVLGATTFHLGIIEGLADSAASLLKLWSGGRSDQAGSRKGFVVFGYSLTAFTRPLIAAIAAPWQLFVVRFSDRIGKGVRTAPRDALIADSTPPGMRGRAFGFHRAMDHVGAAIGPLVALTFMYGWGVFHDEPPAEGPLRILFLATLVPGVLVIALLVFMLREPAATEPAKERVHLTLKPFDRNFRLFLLSLLVFTLGNSSDVFLLVRAQEVGVPVELLPLLWCVFHIVKSAGNWFLGKAVDRVGPRPLLFLGWLVYGGVYLAFGWASAAWHVWALFLAYALFYGLTEPAEKTLVANLAGAEHKGLAYGWYNFAIGIATFPASVIFGWLYYQYSAPVAFTWGAALAAVAGMLLLAVRGSK